jgi:hypothetical protein
MQSSYEDAPYLSVVATARNDDHGGNLLNRVQIFVDAWINQSNRHGLSSELIIVEWNPPAGREPLAEALRWPTDTGVCRVRIIEVPREVHARYRHAAALPLYQMIAKNAGIRRARGEYIVATNIDIVFSDELVRYLASTRLEKGRMYRIDRTDVESDVPVNGTLDEQLAYCRSHVIRLGAREGTYKLSPEGLRKNEPDDITGIESGIHFGSGFYPVERYRPEDPFRWIGNEAEILLRVPAGGAVLELEVEPGPGFGLDAGSKTLEALDWNGSTAARWSISGRTTLHLVVPPDNGKGGAACLRLRVPDGGRPLVKDPRILNFRVFRCDWVVLNSQPAPALSSVTVLREARPMLMRLLGGQRKSHGLMALLSEGAGLCWHAFRLLKARGPDIAEGGLPFRCSQGWHELEGAGVGRFRWVAEDAVLIVRSTRENQSLALLVEPGPGLDFAPFVLLARQADGRVLAKAEIDGVSYVEVPIRAPRGTVMALTLTSERPGVPVGDDPRTLSFRVWALGTGRSLADARGSEAATATAETWAAQTVAWRPAEVDWAALQEKWRPLTEEMGKPEFVHMNACGDFTLMAREHWHDLRGYAELDLFSMHLDSCLCWAAHHGGAREEMLREPMRIYHIEHGAGSGWTPEGEDRLYARIARQGIQTVSYDELLDLIAEMRRLHAPVIFNLEDWGLAGDRLSEMTPQAKRPAMAANKVPS